MHNVVKYWLPVVFYASLIFFVSSIPGQTLPKSLILPNNLLHILEYLPFGFLMCRALKNTRAGLSCKRIIIFSVLLVVIYAISDEFHQMFVPGRYACLGDLFCDGIGAIIGAKIAV